MRYCDEPARCQYSLLARDLGLSTDALDNFASGKSTLPPDKLQALARVFWHGHAEFDPGLDLLRNAVKQEPRSLGVRAAQYVARPQHHAVGDYGIGPQPVKPVPPKARRAGFRKGDPHRCRAGPASKLDLPFTYDAAAVTPAPR